MLFLGLVFLGNILFFIVASLTDIPIETLTLKESANNPYELNITKLLIGINHLLSFTFSAILFVYYYKKQKITNYFMINKVPKLQLVISSFFILLVSYPLIAYTSNLGEWIDLPKWAKTMDESSIDQLIQILHMESPIGLIINLIIIAILPGLGEELLFRGIIQKELQSNTKSPHTAIWITAFIFSAFHLQIEGFLPKMILGLVFGYVFYYTKNLWYPILLHIINNGMQVVGLYFAGDTLDNISIDDSPSIHWGAALGSLVFLAGFWFLANNQQQINKNEII